MCWKISLPATSSGDPALLHSPLLGLVVGRRAAACESHTPPSRPQPSAPVVLAHRCLGMCRLDVVGAQLVPRSFPKICTLTSQPALHSSTCPHELFTQPQGPPFSPHVPTQMLTQSRSLDVDPSGPIRMPGDGSVGQGDTVMYVEDLWCGGVALPASDSHAVCGLCSSGWFWLALAWLRPCFRILHARIAQPSKLGPRCSPRSRSLTTARGRIAPPRWGWGAGGRRRGGTLSRIPPNGATIGGSAACPKPKRVTRMRKRQKKRVLILKVKRLVKERERPLAKKGSRVKTLRGSRRSRG